jgi:hypothetical protein
MVTPSAMFTPIVIPSAAIPTIPSAVFEPFVVESFVVKPSVVEVRSVVPFKVRTIVFIVDTVAVVTTPGRVGIVCVPGVLVFTYSGGLSISAILVYRSRFLINYRRGRCYIHPANRSTESKVGTYIYLRIGRAGEQGTCDDRSKDK